MNRRTFFGAICALFGIGAAKAVTAPVMDPVRSIKVTRTICLNQSGYRTAVTEFVATFDEITDGWTMKTMASPTLTKAIAVMPGFVRKTWKCTFAADGSVVTGVLLDTEIFKP